MRLPGVINAGLAWLGLTVICFPVSALIVFIGLMIFGSHSRDTVNSPIPGRFPVLVITSHYEPPKNESLSRTEIRCVLRSGHDASVVLQENLAAFTKEHADYTFLVPAGEAGEIDQKLRAPQEDEPVFASLEVAPLPNGRQQIHLDASIYDDATNESWYEAAARDFSPRFHRVRSSLAMSIAAAFITPVPALVLSGLAAAVIRWRRSRKKQAKAAQAKTD
jgi:hypothetical protein